MVENALQSLCGTHIKNRHTETDTKINYQTGICYVCRSELILVRRSRLCAVAQRHYFSQSFRHESTTVSLSFYKWWIHSLGLWKSNHWEGWPTVGCHTFKEEKERLCGSHLSVITFSMYHDSISETKKVGLALLSLIILWANHYFPVSESMNHDTVEPSRRRSQRFNRYLRP
jgi:hypothetical protein